MIRCLLTKYCNKRRIYILGKYEIRTQDHRSSRPRHYQLISNPTQIRLTWTNWRGFTISLLKYVGDFCETSSVYSGKHDLDNDLRQWNVGWLGIILDISVVQLVVFRPTKSVVVSSNLIHAIIYMRCLLHYLVNRIWIFFWCLACST